MHKNIKYEVIIVGRSYAGLSAAMTLGRSMRNVLVIDSGKPCNAQTPHTHNVITMDGETPASILEKAKNQVLEYDTIQFFNAIVTEVRGHNKAFEVYTASGEIFECSKLLFTTGINDLIPDIPGYAECWGISILHCPYCHGYEVRGSNIGILGNGEFGFEFCKMLSNWSKTITLFTNGKSELSLDQSAKLKNYNIEIIEKEIHSLRHSDGQLKEIVFFDRSAKEIDAIFVRTNFIQHCNIPENMGCRLTDEGYIYIEDSQETSIAGIYAAGDNCTFYRAVSGAMAAGTKAAAFINKALIEESF